MKAAVALLAIMAFAGAQATTSGPMQTLVHKATKLLTPLVMAKKMSSFTIEDMLSECQRACIHLQPSDCPEAEQTDWSAQSLCRSCALRCLSCAGLQTQHSFYIAQRAFADDTYYANLPDGFAEHTIDERVAWMHQKAYFSAEEETHFRAAMAVGRSLKTQCTGFRTFKLAETLAKAAEE